MLHATSSHGTLASSIVEGATLGGQYRLTHRLSSGGMGTIWQAHDVRLQRQVAIKFLEPNRSDAAAATQRFQREAILAAKIHSPHVVQIYEQGWTFQGEPYIVMELLKGEDLDSRIAREGPLDPQLALSILEQMSVTLSQAHRQGLVHRDIKPHNIFLVPERDEQVFVKLLDFGVAKDIHTPITKLTFTGAFIGTLFYISPEQLTDPQRAGPSADIWATAVTAYEMLTGAVPFGAGAAVPELLFKISRGEFVPATAANPQLPRAIDLVFQRAFSSKAEERFSTIEELCQNLGRVLFKDRDLSPTLSASEVAGYVERVQHELAARPQSNRLRPLHWRMLVAALAAALLCASGSWWWLRSRATLQAKPLTAAATALRPALAQPIAREDHPAELMPEPSPDEVAVMEHGAEPPPPPAAANAAYPNRTNKVVTSKPKSALHAAPPDPADASRARAPHRVVNYGF